MSFELGRPPFKIAFLLLDLLYVLSCCSASIDFPSERAAWTLDLTYCTGVLQKGTVWRHPNLGIAYVAQHAFHHVEEHMEMSPSQYICWRYETGEDKEEQNKVRASKPQ